MIELTNPTARIESLNPDDYQTAPSQGDYKYLIPLESGDLASYSNNEYLKLDEFLLLYFGFNIPVSEKGVNAALNIVGRRFNFLPLLKRRIEDLSRIKGISDKAKITEWLALCSELNFKPCEAVVMAFQGQATTQAETTDNETSQAPEKSNNRIEREFTTWLRETWAQEDKPDGTKLFNALKKYANTGNSPIREHYTTSSNGAGIRYQTRHTTKTMTKKTIQSKVSNFKKEKYCQ